MIENKPKIAIILLNYGDYANKYLVDCLDGLRKQDYEGQISLFIVDNGTSDQSLDYLRLTAPEAEIIRNINNDGFAKGNNDGIRLAMEQGCEYLFLLNLDTVIDDRCVSTLVQVLAENERCGAVQATLLLWPETEKINSLGNKTHFLGFGYCECYGQKIGQTHLDGNVTTIGYPSGAAVMLRTAALQQVGFFDEEFWMYNEDQDLGWRLWLNKWQCLLAPEAIVYHKYEFSRSISKYYWMDRNRLLVIFKNYHWLTLILIFPALIVMECGLFIFAYKGGWIKEKKQVYKYFFNKAHWHYLMQARKKIQATRQVKDQEIIKLFSGVISYQEIESPSLSVANFIFNIYFKVIKFLIIW